MNFKHLLSFCYSYWIWIWIKDGEDPYLLAVCFASGADALSAGSPLLFFKSRSVCRVSFCLPAALEAWKTGLESQEKCRSKNVFSPFEALQQKKCQAVLESCLLVSCFCICWCISLAKTNRGPKDTLNFHFWVWTQQVKKWSFLGDSAESSEHFRAWL